MNKCQNCGKYPFCESIPKEECKEWVKMKYEEVNKCKK